MTTYNEKIKIAHDIINNSIVPVGWNEWQGSVRQEVYERRIKKIKTLPRKRRW